MNVDRRRIAGLVGSALTAALLLVACTEGSNKPEGVPASVTNAGGSPTVPLVLERHFRDGPVQLLQPLDLACQPVARAERTSEEDYPVPRPPFTKGVFPCTRCHDNPNDHNATKRVLTAEHRNIHLVHGPREQWCYDCHNPTNRDTLRLAGGRTVEFAKSYELCGQCHGDKLRDWRIGVHGRRSGCWNGERQYLLCVNCHSPHAPHFRPLQPLPRPRLPGEIALGGGRSHRGGDR